jgi:hypothetical protein
MPSAYACSSYLRILGTLTAVQRDSLFDLAHINRRLVRAYLLKESFQLLSR